MKEAPFMWGVGSAAYQVEGGTDQDGRSESMWDAIRRTSGRIEDGSPPHWSCDSRNRWREDVQLLKDLGVSHYRFSVDWSRVMPDGRTRNPEGMIYYEELCKHLIENSIQPIVTLYHADLPLCLYAEGSWLRASMVDDFVAFAEYCFERLHPWVQTWFTINEIRMHAWAGVFRVEGEPFHSLDLPFSDFANNSDPMTAVLIVSKHMLLAHAKTYRLYHEKYGRGAGGKGRVGLIFGGHWCEAAEEEGSREARQRAFTSLLDLYVQPVKTGEWGRTAREVLGDKLPDFTEDEKQLVKGSIDVFGLNYYRPSLIGPASSTSNGLSAREFQYEELSDNWEKTSGDGHWCRNAPAGLECILAWLSRTFPQLPIIITENGCADHPDEGIEDASRVRFIGDHLKAVARARSAGANVIGYLAWALIDNFEWSDGFAVRFGVHRVEDFDGERKRTAKRSARFYAEYVKSHPKGPSVQ